MRRMVVQQGQFDDAEELPAVKATPKTIRFDSHPGSNDGRKNESTHVRNRELTGNAYAISSACTAVHTNVPVPKPLPVPRIRAEDRHKNDVLCGRGKGPNDYIGNCRFRNIIAGFQQDYFKAKRIDKVPIAKRVFDVVRSTVPAARFLRQDPISPGYWLEVKKEEVIRKISQALREGQHIDRQEREEPVKSRRSQNISHNISTHVYQQPVSARSKCEVSRQENYHNMVSETSSRLSYTYRNFKDASDCLSAFSMLRNGRIDDDDDDYYYSSVSQPNRSSNLK